MGPFEMDRAPDFPETFAGLKYDSVDENVFHSSEDKMSNMKHFLMEPKHDNIAVDSFLGLGMENMGIGSNMEEFSHGFDFSFLPDYGGLDYCSTQDVEAGLELEILDGFLDEVDEVEDIYASHNLSSIETEVKKKVSELDGDPYGLMNFSSETYSPRISGSIGLSEWSKETVPNAESKNVSSDKIKDSLDTHCFYASEDDRKPLSTFISSWGKRGKNRKKNLRNTACSRLNSSGRRMSSVSYDFRPRKGPMKKYIQTSTENTLSDDDQLTSSESEDDISVTNTSKSRSDRRKHQRMWTVDEVVKLVDGISHFGVGKWTDIKNLFFHSASYRTPVDIRDKWRNLLKASYTEKRNDSIQAEEKRRSGVYPIPKDILHRVRELASLHPYPLSKSLSFAHDSSRSLSISRKKKKKNEY
ncbi:Telomere-binding protein 1 [Cardamine amara subsp. amara]|uniref:Telomere-binding protein 1 n=1 Tax=Cardamine amara subsp. amara TaxID=228776 RepID=A0ABD1BF76_CARAN